jgi:hypothetical protein
MSALKTNNNQNPAVNAGADSQSKSLLQQQDQVLEEISQSLDKMAPIAANIQIELKKSEACVNTEPSKQHHQQKKRHAVPNNARDSVPSSGLASYFFFS